MALGRCTSEQSMWPVSSRFGYGLWSMGKSMGLMPKSLPVEEYSDEELDEMDEEVEEEEDIEEPPVKKVTKNSADKRKKPGKGVDEEASDGDSPPKKGKGRGRKAQAAKV